MKKDFKNIWALYDACKTNRDQYKPLWDTIAMYTGINVQPDYLWANNQGKKSQQLDFFVDDPTSAQCVNQFGDYMRGIMWGTGDNAFDIVPSRYVKELVDDAEVEDFYAFATDQALYHMNHVDAGFSTALGPYAYDQAAFGTSAIGVFPNKDFLNGVSHNALIFRNYGVDNMAIDEGRSGLIEIVFAVYHWKVNRIVGEFAMTDGAIDAKKMGKLPKAIQDAHKSGNYNQEFNIVFGFFPREDFDPKLKGKRGTRYRGVWFMDQPTENNIFAEEDFAERPICVARQIKVRGEVWGRSSGTMLISTIRSVNFMVGQVIEILEKMANPSLGLWNNAIFGDSVLDTSADGLNIFNAGLNGDGKPPVFPLYTVGDPSGIVQFLIPYLTDKITTGFKVDILLDFSTAKEMTATESLQRYVIRGKSLSGILQQQKIEGMEPTAKRSISILFGMGEMGVDPVTNPERARALRENRRDERIIPEAVLQVIKEGRPWYELKWNNELEKLSRTEAVQALVQIIQTITAIAAIHPEITYAVDWYKLLKDINDNLDFNNQLLFSADEFKAKIDEIAAMKREAMMIEATRAGSEIKSNNASANEKNAKAANVQPA